MRACMREREIPQNSHTYLKVVCVCFGLDDLSNFIALQVIVGDDGLHCGDVRVCHLVQVISVHVYDNNKTNINATFNNNYE